MNDLERDLHELFATKARGVEASPEAPVDVLRRGRRRQTTTVVAGAIGGVAAIALALAVVLSVTQAPDRIPATTDDDVPERVTTIGGVPITAPAGWTLINDWPLASVIGTSSETCTFEGEGVPVGQTDASTAPSQGDCVETPTDLPAGVPVLQLANWEIPLLETVCGLTDQPATALPADGVAVYVGQFPQGVSTQAFMDACPGSETVRDMSVVTTFMSHDPVNGTPDGTYAAIVVAGVGASREDLSVASQSLERLGGITIDQPVPASGGPGYVLAAGEADDVTWRFEAGIDSLTDGPGQLAAVLAVSASREAGTETVLPVTGERVDHLTHLFEIEGVRSYVTFGTAGSDVTAVDIVTGDASTAASMFGWPVGIAGTSSGSAPAEGSLWFAVTPEQGQVVPTLLGSATPPPSEAPSTAGRLETRVEDGTTIGTFEAFGRPIEISIDPEGLVTVEGHSGALLLQVGTGARVDVEGGSIMLDHLREGERTWVTLSDGTRIDAAWMALPRIAGMTAPGSRLWITALPGSGTGLEHGGLLPMAISWPTHEIPQEGDVISAGADDLSSWAIRWWNGCPHLEVVDTATGGGEGTTGCITPWDGESGSEARGLFGGDIATVWVTGPEGMQLEPASAEADPVYGQCGTVVNAEGWDGTEICIVTFEAGRTVRLRPVTVDGNSLGRVIELTVRNGSLAMIQ